MKMMKKVLAVVLSLVMVFAFAACAGNGETKDPEEAKKEAAYDKILEGLEFDASGLPELTEISLPESLEIIDDAVMANCPKLREISFGSGLQYIGWRAFMLCSSLNRVIIPGDEVKIGEEAFAECAEDLEIIKE